MPGSLDYGFLLVELKLTAISKAQSGLEGIPFEAAAMR